MDYLFELLLLVVTVTLVVCGSMTVGTSVARGNAGAGGEVDYPFEWYQFFARRARVRRATLRSVNFKYKPKVPFWKFVVTLVLVYAIFWVPFEVWNMFISPLWSGIWGFVIRLLIITPLIAVVFLYNTAMDHQTDTPQVWVNGRGPFYAREFVPGQYTDALKLPLDDPDVVVDPKADNIHVEYISIGALNGPHTLTHANMLLILGANVVGDDRASRQAGTLNGMKYEVESEKNPEFYPAGDLKYVRKVQWIDRAKRVIPGLRINDFSMVMICLDTRGNGHKHIDGEPSTLKRELFESIARNIQLQAKYGDYVRSDQALRGFDSGGRRT